MYQKEFMLFYRCQLWALHVVKKRQFLHLIRIHRIHADGCRVDIGFQRRLCVYAFTAFVCLYFHTISDKSTQL